MSGAEADGGVAKQVTVDSVSTILLPDIIADGHFAMDTLIYCRVDFTDITGRLSYEDRRVVCRDVSGKVYSGQVTGRTTIDLANMQVPVYEGEYSATQIEADDFVRRFTKFGGHLFGRFDLTGTYRAEGWEPDEFLSSLTMDSDGVMQNGRVVTSGSVHKVLSALAELVGSSFDENQALKNAQTKLAIRDGQVRLDTLRTRLGTFGELSLAGFYSFNNDLSYRGTILLSPETTKRLTSGKGLLGAVSGLLSSGDGHRLELPFTVTGTIDNPKAEIDYSVLTKRATENLVDEAGKKLLDLFKK